MYIDGFKLVENKFWFNKDFREKYKKDSDEGYVLELDVQYLKNLQNIHNDLPFSTKIMKIEKVEKLVANLHG